MTNNHVVAGAREIKIWLLDGRSLAATVIASASAPDVAVLRVQDPPADIVPLATGNSKTLKQSQPLVAVGHLNDVGNWVVSFGAFRELRTALRRPNVKGASTS